MQFSLNLNGKPAISAIIANKLSADIRDKLQHFDGFLAGKEN